LLIGDAGSELDVIVYSSRRSAADAFGIEQRQAGAGSFDRVLANVLVVSDGLSPAERQRVLDGLAELRRSAPPEVTGGSRCAPGATHPIGKFQFARVLSNHGLRLEPDPSSGSCSAEDVGLVLTNYDTTADDLGLLECNLRLAPIYRTAAPWIVSKADLGGKLGLDLANAECTVYPRGSAGQRQAAALEAALREIRHTINHAAGETQALYTSRDVRNAFGGVGLKLRSLRLRGPGIIIFRPKGVPLPTGWLIPHPPYKTFNYEVFLYRTAGGARRAATGPFKIDAPTRYLRESNVVVVIRIGSPQASTVAAALRNL
jgi:hypothetical protein